MGEGTICNFCSLQRIRARAKKDNFKVTLEHGSIGMGGIDVYVHPKNVEINPKNKLQRDKYFASWFMELPEKVLLLV